MTTPEKKTKRKLIDWDSVEPLFKLGTLSNYQICSQYAEDHRHSDVWKQNITEGSIRNRAKTQGWQKNIADKVQIQIKEKVLRKSLRNDDLRNKKKLTDKEIIEEAAEVGSNVILRHRTEIKALLDLEESFLIELGGTPTRGQFASFKGGISSIDVDLTVSEKAKTLKDMAAVRAQRIALERQAFNIKDDTEPDDGKGEDRVWTINGIRAQPRVIE